MHIVTTKSKGEFDVIVGFRKQHIDPQATRAATIEALNAKGLPDYLDKAQISVDKAVKLPKQTKGKRGLIDAAHDVLIEAQKRYASECSAEQSGHIVYLPPKDNETLKSGTDAKALKAQFKALKRKEYLTLDGQVIKDIVGREYWGEVDGRWEMTTIAEFGETPPTGSKTLKGLNKNQRKAIRDQDAADGFEALTKKQKSGLHTTAVRGAELAAVQMRSLAEIKGVDAAKALSDAAEWLNAELVKLAEKYA